MASYDMWIYHRENANATVSLNVLEQNEGIPERDEIFYVLDDMISDGVEVDPVVAESSNVQYDKLFTALNSEFYPRVSSFSLLNFLVKLMH